VHSPGYPHSFWDNPSFKTTSLFGPLVKYVRRLASRAQRLMNEIRASAHSRRHDARFRGLKGLKALARLENSPKVIVFFFVLFS